MSLKRWPWLLVVLLADFAASSTSANILAVTQVTVIDTTGAAPRSDRTILITDDLITGIGRGEDIHLPTNATVVNAAGKFVITDRNLLLARLPVLSAERVKRGM